jgi:hypothetical protein
MLFLLISFAITMFDNVCILLTFHIVYTMCKMPYKLITQHNINATYSMSCNMHSGLIYYSLGLVLSLNNP